VGSVDSVASVGLEDSAVSIGFEGSIGLEGSARVEGSVGSMSPDGRMIATPAVFDAK